MAVLTGFFQAIKQSLKMDITRKNSSKPNLFLPNLSLRAIRYELI